MKSIWRGHIRFSLVNIPVQVFNAVENANYIRFNQLHEADFGRVRYHKVCEQCEEVLKSKEIIKGFEYADDQYVTISKEEFASIKVKSTKTIEIEGFIDLNEVHPTRYEAVYFIGPHEEQSIKTFSLFVRSLRETGKAGVGRIVLRDKEDVVLIKAFEKGLIMYKLRYPYEIRNIDDVPDLQEIEVEEAQLNLAKTLIASMTTSFDKINFVDAYQEALQELIDKKVQGEEIVVAEELELPSAQVDIMEALKASIEEAKKEKKKE